VKLNFALRSLHKGRLAVVTLTALGATQLPTHADPTQATGATNNSAPTNAPRLSAVTKGSAPGYIPTNTSTAIFAPALNQGAPVATKVLQPVTPRYSLAESPMTSRISLVMTSIHGTESFHSRVATQLHQVVSYPLSFGASISQPRTLVATTPVTARPIATTTRPTTPKTVAQPAPAANSRKSDHDTRTLLAMLDQEQRRLDSADAHLSEGQRQLSRFADTLRQAMLEAGPDATGLHPFVRVAQRYAGTPYVWGGESARGFDCSGFIIRVMRDLGYQALPHSAAEQFTYGKPIAQPLLKPGDLVFFANTYKPGISHVGIYLGKRHFIHAAGTGKGTIVSTLDDAHYQAHYAGARRLIAAH